MKKWKWKDKKKNQHQRIWHKRNGFFVCCVTFLSILSFSSSKHHHSVSPSQLCSCPYGINNHKHSTDPWKHNSHNHIMMMHLLTFHPPVPLLCQMEPFRPSRLSWLLHHWTIITWLLWQISWRNSHHKCHECVVLWCSWWWFLSSGKCGKWEGQHWPSVACCFWLLVLAD